VQTRGGFTGLEHRLTLKFLSVAAANAHQMVMVPVIIIARQLETPPTLR
jgi:hypothetical protein